jgi:hypothetical protein
MRSPTEAESDTFPNDDETTSIEDVERLRVELNDAFDRARAAIDTAESQLLAAALFGGRPGHSRDQRRVA